MIVSDVISEERLSLEEAIESDVECSKDNMITPIIQKEVHDTPCFTDVDNKNENESIQIDPSKETTKVNYEESFQSFNVHNDLVEKPVRPISKERPNNHNRQPSNRS